MKVSDLNISDFQPKTRVPILCINCVKERILHWHGLYAQWLCGECINKLPSNSKTLRFKTKRGALLRRKYSLRHIDKWKGANL